jgi:uncharacterized membrane protein YkoI
LNIKHFVLASAATAVISMGLAQAAEPSQAELMAKAKITQAEAESIALAKVRSGTVKSAELEQEHGALVWSFDIATPKSKNIHEILVNAVTGKIVHTEIENPAAQAKENAAEQVEKQKQPQ